MANLKKLKNENKSNNEKLMRSCANLVSKEVLNHYQKARIPVLHEYEIAEKLIKLHSDYKSLYKIKPEKRKNHSKIIEFRERLNTTMPFWPRHVEKIMEDGKRGKSNEERQAIDEDILFLKWMNTDRIAFYTEKDQHTAEAEESRKVRQQKRENLLKNAKP